MRFVTVRLPSSVRRLLPAILGIALTTGCAGVNSNPFDEFALSVGELRAGTNAAIDVNAEWTRETFLDRAVEASQGDTEEDQDFFVSMQFEHGSDALLTPVIPSTHVFLEVRRFRTGIDALNGAFVQYAQLLAQLASASLIKPETFDDLARNLNGNAGAALKAFGVSPPQRELALFSVAAAGGARALVEHRRKERLGRTLAANQPIVSELAAAGQKAVEISVKVFTNAYGDRSKALGDEILAASAAEAKRKKLEELIALNDFYLSQINVYRSLHNGYALIVEGHAELAKGLEGESGLGAIRSLYDEGRRLHRLAEELAKEAGEEK